MKMKQVFLVLLFSAIPLLGYAYEYLEVSASPWATIVVTAELDGKEISQELLPSNASCVLRVDDGSTATITAQMKSGAVLVGWTGDASGTQTTVSVVMNGDKKVALDATAE